MSKTLGMDRPSAGPRAARRLFRLSAIALVLSALTLSSCASGNRTGVSRIAAGAAPDAASEEGGGGARPDPTEGLPVGMTGGADPLLALTVGDFTQGLPRGRSGGADPSTLPTEFTLTQVPTEAELALILASVIGNDYTVAYSSEPAFITKATVVNLSGRQAVHTTYGDGTESWALYDGIERSRICIRGFGGWRCDADRVNVQGTPDLVTLAGLMQDVPFSTPVLTGTLATASGDPTARISSEDVNGLPSTCVEWAGESLSEDLDVSVTAVCINEAGVPTRVSMDVDELGYLVIQATSFSTSTDGGAFESPA